MSKSDEMFKKLGYKKREHNFKVMGDVIEYNDNKEGLCPIDFMLKTKEIKIWHINIGIKELQAITQKCKELGWLDE